MKCTICENESAIALCNSCISGMQAILEEGIAATFTTAEQAGNAMKIASRVIRQFANGEMPKEDKQPDTFADEYSDCHLAIRGLANNITLLWPENLHVEMLMHDNAWQEIPAPQALGLLATGILHTFRYTPGV